MGSVYEVEDVSVGKRYVVKTLHPQLISRHDLTRRMEAEARTLGKLQHPNIVDIITAGVTREEVSVPYFVMERLNGQNLRVTLQKIGLFVFPDACHVAIGVLDALQCAHENGVIHRDVKPENIFLHRNVNGTMITKLLDFGIVRLLDQKSCYTQGKFIGTLRYASPEQIMGGDILPVTDIYSFGAVFYEMLCGHGPFDDAGDAYAVGAAHAQCPPPPLSRFVDVPSSVERLVMSMLAKRPSDRPRDCFSIVSELRRASHGYDARSRSATAVDILPLAQNARLSSPGSLLDASTATDALASGELHHVVTPPGGASADGVPNTSGMSDTMFDPEASTRRDAYAPTVGGTPEARRKGGTALLKPVEPAPYLVDRNVSTRTTPPVRRTALLAPHGTLVDSALAASTPEQSTLRSSNVQPLHAQNRSPIKTLRSAGTENVGNDLTNARTSTAGVISSDSLALPPKRHVVLPFVLAAVVLTAIGGAAFALRGRLLHAANDIPNATASGAPASSVIVPAVEPGAPAAPASAVPAASTQESEASVAADSPDASIAAVADASLPIAPARAVGVRGARRGGRVTPPVTSASAKPPTQNAGGAVRPEEVGF